MTKLAPDTAPPEQLEDVAANNRYQRTVDTNQCLNPNQQNTGNHRRRSMQADLAASLSSSKINSFSSPDREASGNWNPTEDMQSTPQLSLRYTQTAYTCTSISTEDQRVLDGIVTSHDPDLAKLKDKLSANPQYIHFFRDKSGDAIGTYANKSDDLSNELLNLYLQREELSANEYIKEFIEGLKNPRTYANVDRQRRNLPRDLREAFNVVRDINRKERELRTIKSSGSKIAGREQLAMLEKLINSGRVPELEERFDPSIEIGGPNSFSRNSQNPYVPKSALKDTMMAAKQDGEARRERQVAAMNPRVSGERVAALKKIQNWRSGADVRMPREGSYEEKQAYINSINPGLANTGGPQGSTRMSVVGVGTEGIEKINDRAEQIYQERVTNQRQFAEERVVRSVERGEISPEQGKLRIDIKEFNKALETTGNSRTQYAAWQKAHGLFIENLTARVGLQSNEEYLKDLLAKTSQLTSEERVLRQMARELMTKQYEIFESAIKRELSNNNINKAEGLIRYLENNNNYAAAMSSEQMQALKNQIEKYRNPETNPFGEEANPFVSNSLLQKPEHQAVSYQKPSESIEIQAGSYRASGFKLNIAGKEIKVDRNQVRKITKDQPFIGEGFSISKGLGVNNYIVTFDVPGEHKVAVKTGNIYGITQSVTVDDSGQNMVV